MRKLIPNYAQIVHQKQKMKKLIDSEVGALFIEDCKVNLSDSLQNIVDLLGDKLTIQDQRYGWDEYKVRTIEMDGDKVIINLLFENRRLKIIQIYVSFSEFKEEKDWNDWSKKSELKKELKLETWLDNQIGKQRIFKWGTAKSSFDKKGGFSSITIKST